MTERCLCSIYRSTRKDEAYLYVDKRVGLKEVPEALLAQFGKPVHVADLLITPERKLARAEAPRVLEKIAAQGYYLQLPPPREAYMLDLFRKREDS
ncbi:MAG: YcgL domain-containing protein [Gammaproteobacteria bacterium]|nr:YcgL domain-containing protein [Gammaproteobacteria bacterium]